MALVPGLTSVGNGPTAGKRIARRAEAPDPTGIRSPSLNPVASPVDTYVRPEAPPQGNVLSSLADALATINPAIQRYMQVAKPDPEDSVAAARRVVQQTDPLALDKMMREGNTPAEFQTMQGMGVWGEAKAYADVQEIFRRYNEGFDKDKGDPSLIIQEVTAQAFDAYGNDRAFLDPYTKIIEEARQKLLATHAEYQTNAELTRRQDTVFSAWAGRVDYMVADGKPPAEIVESMFRDIPDNRDFLLLHPKDQQKMLLQIADQQATKGNFDVAKAILSMERKDGAYSGSLMSDRELGEQATTLFARIEADQRDAALKAQSAEAEAQLYDMAAARVQDGTIIGIQDATIPGPDGQPKVISADTILKETARRELQDVQEQAAYRGITDPAAIKLEEMKRFVGTGLEHPTWFQSMNSAYTQASVNNISGATLPGPLVDGFSLYRDLYTHSPQYLAKYLDSKALDFYHAADVYMTTGLANTPEDALRLAQLVTRNPNERDSNTNARFDRIDDEVATAIGGSSNVFKQWFMDGPSEASNVGYVKATITDTAKILARGGMGVDEALTKAREVFEETHINVAGSFIRNDKRLPGDFAPLVNQYLAEFAQTHGEDVSNLTIIDATNGSGGYMIMEKGTYTFAGPTATFFNLADLEALRKRNRDEAEKAVVEEANQ